MVGYGARPAQTIVRLRGRRNGIAVTLLAGLVLDLEEKAGNGI